MKNEIRRLISGAAAFAGLAVGSPAISQNQPTEALRGSIQDGVMSNIDNIARLKKLPTLIAQNGDARNANFGTQNSQLASALRFDGKLGNTPVGDTQVGVQAVSDTKFGAGISTHLVLSGQNYALAGLYEKLRYAHTSLIAGATNISGFSLSGSYSSAKQSAEKYYDNKDYSGKNIQGNKFTLILTKDEVGILRDVGIHVSVARTKKSIVSQTESYEITTTETELLGFKQTVESRIKNISTQSHTGGKDFRTSVGATVPVSDSLDLSLKAGGQILSWDGYRSKNPTISAGFSYVPNSTLKLEGGAYASKNVNGVSIAASTIIGNGGAELQAGIASTGGPTRVFTGLNIPLDGNVRPYSLSRRSNGAGSPSSQVTSMLSPEYRADPTSIGEVRTTQRTEQVGLNTIYDPLAVETEIQSVDVKDDGTVSLVFRNQKGGALPLSTGLPSAQILSVAGRSTPQASLGGKQLLVEYYVLLKSSDNTVEKILVSGSPAQFKLPASINGKFTLQIQTNVTIDNKTSTSISPSYMGTRYINTVSIISDLKLMGISPTSATIAYKVEDKEGIRGLKWSASTRSGNAPGRFIISDTFVTLVDITPGQQYIVTLEGETANKKPDGTLEWTPFIRKTSEILFPELPDDTPPTVTLAGEGTVTLEIGDTWTDPGATCIDNKDPNCVVIVTGTVNTSKAGTYTISYSAKDSAGNTLPPITRTVIVKEKKIDQAPDVTLPTLTLTPTSVVFIGGSIADSDNQPGYVSPITYQVKDQGGNVVNKDALTPGTAYTYTLMGMSYDGITKTLTPVIRTGTFSTPFPNNTLLQIGNIACELTTVVIGDETTCKVTPIDPDGISSLSVSLNGLNLSAKKEGASYIITLPRTSSITDRILTVTATGKNPNGTDEAPQIASVTIKSVYPADTPLTLGGITGPSTFIAGQTANYSIPITDPNGFDLSNITVTFGGITVTPTLVNGILSVTAPLTLAAGSHTLTVQAKGNNPDGTINPTSIEKSMSLTVQSANVAPVATTGSTTIPFGGTATLDASQLATDANGDTLIITSATSANGTITLSPDKKSLIFFPANGFSGVTTMNYVISDGKGGIVNGERSITVQQQPNRAPVTNPDSATTAYSTPITVDVISNDTDPDGNILKLSRIISVIGGTASMSGDKSISFIPSNGFSGVAKIIYEASDGRSGVTNGELSITVSPDFALSTSSNLGSTNLGSPLIATATFNAPIVGTPTVSGLPVGVTATLGTSGNTLSIRLNIDPTLFNFTSESQSFQFTVNNLNGKSINFNATVNDVSSIAQLNFSDVSDNIGNPGTISLGTVRDQFGRLMILNNSIVSIIGGPNGAKASIQSGNILEYELDLYLDKPTDRQSIIFIISTTAQGSMLTGNLRINTTFLDDDVQ